jgi:hypothetical protein
VTRHAVSPEAVRCHVENAELRDRIRQLESLVATLQSAALAEDRAGYEASTSPWAPEAL